MRRVVFAPEAQDDLLAIGAYVAARAGVATARRFTESILDYCESFSTFPERGTLRDDIRQELRTIGFRRLATIAFHAGADTVTILGIFYGGRDIESALSTQPRERRT